jgi:hypothetical protein
MTHMGTRFRARGMLMCVCATAITYAALGRRDEDLLQMVCEESGYKSKVRLHAPCRPDSQLILVRRMITVWSRKPAGLSLKMLN